MLSQIYRLTIHFKCIDEFCFEKSYKSREWGSPSHLSGSKSALHLQKLYANWPLTLQVRVFNFKMNGLFSLCEIALKKLKMSNKLQSF